MNHAASSRVLPQLLASTRRPPTICRHASNIYAPSRPFVSPSLFHNRCLSTTRAWQTSNLARRTNEKDQKAQEDEVKDGLAEATKRQIRRPWQREAADRPPVDEQRRQNNKNMAKGKILTTPTRLLKLVLPLPFDALHDEHGNRGEFRALAQNEDIEPLALLVHPQQPLSYLERLIQAEIPPLKDEHGREKIPNVYFLAETTNEEQLAHKADKNKPGLGQNVASYSGAGREGNKTPEREKNWVRWSSSTEIGDFIRDAARGREFAVQIDGFESDLRVGVPSFGDRTHYMRLRLRRMSRRINDMSKIKHECDELAHRGAHRIAKAGFGALAAWWGAVYFVTFHTDAGWDLVEPVTYLAGLTTIMGGYLWFLTMSRDISYQAAMRITVSKRQNILYQSRGFDVNQWEQLVTDANTLRREIRIIAEEYDVEYQEERDVGGEEVREVLDQEDGKKDDATDEGDDKSKKQSKRPKATTD